MTRTASTPPGAPIACPFCGLLCDDLSLPLRSGRRDPAALTCPRAREGFTTALALAPAEPRIDGEPASWDDALARCAALLRDAALPLVSGHLGDVQDVRAAVRLAERLGGVFDHANSDGLARMLAVYQQTGWQTTSLGELRNRADLVVLIGGELKRTAPRLVERLFEPTQRLHTEGPPRVIELNDDRLATLSRLRALLAGRRLDQPADAALVALADAIREASYPVFVITDLADPDADLDLRVLVELVRELNERGRAALLTWGGHLGEPTAQLTAAWHGGFGVRTSFEGGLPLQDLDRNATRRLLASGEADLLIWIASLDRQPPPASAAATIVLGRADIELTTEPALFLPLAIPGIDRPGLLYRADAVRPVPLSRLRQSPLPTTRELCDRMLALLPREVAAC